MSNATPNLSTIITNTNIRKIIYAVYAVAALGVGGAAAYFLGIGESLPVLITGAQSVIAYLAIPIGALALVNTPARGVSE